MELEKVLGFFFEHGVFNHFLAKGLMVIISICRQRSDISSPSLSANGSNGSKFILKQSQYHYISVILY